jgi:CheY-like chemotaxis protein
MTKRVLVAEDEPNIVESLRFLLERAGYDLTICGNGREALKVATESRHDVMVLDVMLPEMNGLDVLRALRADPDARKLPVLMLTAKGQREDREDALAAGADMFISKPFSNAELVEAVGELANGRAN